ncbi:hypothetical protein [Lactobacillus sp. PV034]|uniref:hypothetical protein n=1 Tax=Lactobacillus sp. PV034 TaxID=2594495 RepID=UPI0022401598|nr:hypothetical protein [Lactobacillus sp. PV034]QNQ81089.1 hypothetical protein FP432_05715 [Lactobacillus sp. PV034]
MSNNQQRAWLWITLTILIVISIFIPNNSSWYFPANFVILILIYLFYWRLMALKHYGAAILEAGIAAIWFDNYFKAPFGNSYSISICFTIIGVILMIIAIICDIRAHHDEQ